MRHHTTSVWLDDKLEKEARAIGITNFSAVLDEALRSKVANELGQHMTAFIVTCKNRYCGASFSNLAWLKCSDEKKGRCLVCGEPIKITRRKK